jgi:small subunit ribosomal protein S6
LERHYETILIIKPDLGDEAIKGIIQKASDSLKKGGGQVNKVDEWGRRRLAYPIQKKHEGFYVLFDYSSSADASKELERILKLNEDVVRLQTVKFEGPVAPAVVAEAPAAEVPSTEAPAAAEQAPAAPASSEAAPAAEEAPAAPVTETPAAPASSKAAPAPTASSEVEKTEGTEEAPAAEEKKGSGEGGANE